MPQEQNQSQQKPQETPRDPPPVRPTVQAPNTTALQADADNPLIPADDQLELLTTTIHVNKVATADTVTAILGDLTRRHANATIADLVSLAWACYHNGSSRYTSFDSHSPTGVPHSEIKDMVENHCTLRQFCTYYGKICYNMGRASKTPPANWASKGFNDDTKYAAFDFFNGVSNPAVPPPRSGMKYKPTEAEMRAHATNATMAIIESRPQPNHFSNRGNMMAMQQIRTAPPNPLITFD